MFAKLVSISKWSHREFSETMLVLDGGAQAVKILYYRVTAV